MDGGIETWDAATPSAAGSNGGGGSGEYPTPGSHLSLLRTAPACTFLTSSRRHRFPYDPTAQLSGLFGDKVNRKFFVLFLSFSWVRNLGNFLKAFSIDK